MLIEYFERLRTWAFIAVVLGLVLPGCLATAEGEALDCDEMEEPVSSEDRDSSCGVRAGEFKPSTWENPFDGYPGSCHPEDCGAIEDPPLTP